MKNARFRILYLRNKIYLNKEITLYWGNHEYQKYKEIL